MHLQICMSYDESNHVTYIFWINSQLEVSKAALLSTVLYLLTCLYMLPKTDVYSCHKLCKNMLSIQHTHTLSGSWSNTDKTSNDIFITIIRLTLLSDIGVKGTGIWELAKGSNALPSWMWQCINRDDSRLHDFHWVKSSLCVSFNAWHVARKGIWSTK